MLKQNSQPLNNLNVGDSYKIEPIVLTDNKPEDYTLTITAEDPSIIEVNNGVLTGLKEGKTKIIATAGTCTTFTELTVITPVVVTSVTPEINPITISKEELDRVVPILKSKIQFTEDIKNFTFYAFMNYTGYDLVNNAQYETTRQAIVADLKAMNLQLSDPTYYKTHNNNMMLLSDIRNIGTAPDFNNLGIGTPGCSDLPAKLNEFYTKANIPTLFAKYKPDYDKEMAKYNTDAYYVVLAKILHYLKIDPNTVQPFDIDINLLEAFQKGSGLGAINKATGKGAIILGPSYQANILNIVHEFLHSVINPILAGMPDVVNSMTPVLNKVPENTQAKMYYNEINSFLGDSLIHSLENKPFRNHDDNYIQFLTNEQGFIMSKYLDEKWDDFANYNGSLSDFIKNMLLSFK